MNLSELFTAFKNISILPADQSIWPFLFLIIILLQTMHYMVAKKKFRLFKEIFKKTTGARFLVNKYGFIIERNPECEKFLDLGKATQIKDFFALFKNDPKTFKSLKEIHAEILTEGEERRMRFKRIPKGGTTPLWFDLRVSPISKEIFFWRFEEITESYEQESEFNKIHKQLQNILKQTPTAHFSLNRKGEILYANPLFLEILNLDKTDLKRYKFHDLFLSPPIDAKPFELLKTNQKDIIQKAIVQFKKNNNDPVPVFIIQKMVYNDKGEFYQSFGTVIDLKENKLWLDQVKASERKFYHFFESAPDGILLINSKGEIINYNHAFKKIFELEEIPRTGANLFDYLESEHKGEFKEELARIIKNPKTDMLYEITLKKFEPEKILQIHGRLLKHTSNEAYITLHFMNITEQKQLEIQFTHSQKMQAIGQLAGGIAHDFNNLLTALIGYSDLLLLRHRAGDPSFHDLMQIKQNAQRGANLVKQLLAFSRKQTLQTKCLDLSDILTDLTQLLKRLIGESITLEMFYDKDLWPVIVDKSQFEQVIINLAVNARDAMHQKGRLTLKISNKSINKALKIGSETMPAGDYVMVEVSDTGVGIAPAILERIFEPFFSTKDLGEGTGLGLSTAHGIIHQIGGFIQVKSEIGKGTSFFIYLPKAEKEALEALSAKDEKEKEKNATKAKQIHDLTGLETILLVEDEEAVRSFSARALRNKGYHILEATSGEEGLEIFEKEEDTIDLIITDVMMPNLNGFEFIEKLYKKKPNIKVIFISGYAKEQFLDKFDANKPVFFLHKPYTLKELAEKVRQILLM